MTSTKRSAAAGFMISALFSAACSGGGNYSAQPRTPPQVSGLAPAPVAVTPPARAMPPPVVTELSVEPSATKSLSPAPYRNVYDFIDVNSRPSQDPIPRDVNGWRDVFVVVGQTEEAAQAATKALDTLFSNPDVSAALADRVADNRYTADYIESHRGAGLPRNQAAEAIRSARHKTVVLAASDETDAGILDGRLVHLSIGGKKTSMLTGAAIVLTLVPPIQYMGKDGAYHDDSLLGAAAHEIGHFIRKQPLEQPVTDQANIWMTAVDPSYAPRGNYFLTRLTPDSWQCREYDTDSFRDTLQAFDNGMKKRNRADPLPTLRDAHGKALRGKALVWRMAEEYYSNCPQHLQSVKAPGT
jgi:hypothetical protein